MTVIVFDGRTMAADTQAEIDDVVKNMTYKKLCRFKGHLLGISGSDIPAWDILKTWFLLPHPRPAVKTYKFDLLVVDPDRRIYSLDHRGSITEAPKKFWAIGSGGAYAIGALAEGASARKAAQIAIEFAPGCGGNVMTLRLK